MRVIHVCYSVNGGAGRAALRLHGSLAKLGADSHIFAFDQAASIPRSGHESPGAFDKLLASEIVARLPFLLQRARDH